MIPIYRYGETPESVIFARNSGAVDVSAAVAEIVARVAEEGDKALLDYARQFDHAELTSLAGSRQSPGGAGVSADPGGGGGAYPGVS